MTTTFPGATWESKTPENAGVNSAKLNKFVIALGTGSGVIIKDGYLIKSWGDQTIKFDWASAAKPVTTTMMLFALKENKISSLDELTRPYVQTLTGLDYITKDRSITFRHLINMVSGYALSESPGTHWAYNDYGVNLYSKILFDVIFKQTANIATTTRLSPLQFQDGSVYSSRSGYGVSTTPRDFARIGLLLLNKYNWKGTQLLPISYFDIHTKILVSNNTPVSPSTTINDYLSIGSYGGSANQNTYGPGIYGSAIWFNELVGTTQNRSFPNSPLDTFEANGHSGKEVMVIIPSLGIIAAAKGNWGGFNPGISNSPDNLILKLLTDSIIQPTIFTRKITISGNGTVNIFKNGTLIGTATQTTPFNYSANIGDTIIRESVGSLDQWCNLQNVCNTEIVTSSTFISTSTPHQEYIYYFITVIPCNPSVCDFIITQ